MTLLQERSSTDTIKALELLRQLPEEKDVDKRAEIIRKLGNISEPRAEVVKALLDLRSNLEKEDPFVQYEIKLSIHRIVNNPNVNIDFFLKNLKIFERQNKSQAPKMLIDSNLIEEFLLREKTTLDQDASQVVECISSGKISPYIGKNGLRNIWLNIQEIEGQEYANRLILEILSQFKVCEIDFEKIDREKYPTVTIPTLIQIECAKQYELDGIITLRDRDFIGSGYDSVCSPSLFVQNIEPELSPEGFKTELSKSFLEQTRGELLEQTKGEFNLMLEKDNSPEIDFEDNLPLFAGWKIEKFEVLCSHYELTSATVILRNQNSDKRYKESAFRKGSVHALFTAFDKALSHIVEIKHELKSIYVVNLQADKQGPVTAHAVIKSKDNSEEVITVYRHENLIKAYLFAYVKAIVKLYAPDEYQDNILDEKDLTGLYRIGKTDFHQLNFSKVDLTDSDPNLSGANLRGCDFSNANLSGADLTKADLTDANLSQANLSKANLTEADLSRANLSKANLTEADLTGVKLDENNRTLFEDTTLVNTKMPEIKIAISGQLRIDTVTHLLRQVDVTKRQCQVLAVHSMITAPQWWYSDQGRHFFEVNQELIKKGIPIKRVFILPENPTEDHLDIIREQKDSGIEVLFISCNDAKNIDNQNRENTNLLIFENLSVPRNSFTTRMLINERDEGGYISYQDIDIRSNQHIFSPIWEKAIQKVGLIQ